MNNKEIFYFAGRCLMLDECPEFADTIIEKIEAQTIDWSQFVTLCNNHLILPVIYIKFKRHDLISHLPVELSEFLIEIYDLNVSRNKEILRQISAVTSLMNQNNIYPLFVKGAAHILDNLYSDIGERILADIDFLVPEKDYIPAVRVLENDGYFTFDGNPNYFDPEIEKHYPRLSKHGFSAIIEIHRLLTDVPLKWFDAGTVIQQKKKVSSVNGCFVPSDEHKIIHNFVHTQITHGGHSYCTISLRDLYDLHLISQRISILNVLPHIPLKQKAISYFAFGDAALGKGLLNYGKAKFSAWLFKKRHDLNQISPTFYYINRLVAFLRYKIVERYYVQGTAFFGSKKMRSAVFKRLGDPRWHKERLKEFSRIFLPNTK